MCKIRAKQEQIRNEDYLEIRELFRNCSEQNCLYFFIKYILTSLAPVFIAF